MKNLINLLRIGLVVLGLSFTACDNGTNPSPDLGNGNLTKLTGTVSIDGTTQVGETLTADTSKLGGSGTISYQWKRDGNYIGANGKTYIERSGDVGYAIETVTRDGYTGSVGSGVTAMVTITTPNLAFILINNNTAYSVSKGTVTAANGNTGSICIS